MEYGLSMEPLVLELIWKGVDLLDIVWDESINGS